MDLPAITLPKIDIPFDIPVLLHPVAAHFIVAIPVAILLVEILNLIFRKRAIGGVAFFLILLAIGASVVAFLTGGVDGKEAYEGLSTLARSELAEHKLLGTYIMLGSLVVLLFKLFSMIIKHFMIKLLYLLVLIGFVIAIFTQGKEGGELVYKYGVNVAQVKTLSDKVFDLEDEMEDMKESEKSTTTAPKTVEAPVEVIKVPAPVVVAKPVQETKAPKVTPVQESKAATKTVAPAETVAPAVSTVGTVEEEQNINILEVQ